MRIAPNSGAFESGAIDKLLKYRPFAVLFASACYSSSIISFATGISGSLITITFLAALFGMLWMELQCDRTRTQSLSALAWIVTAMYSGIALGAFLVNAPSDVFWLADSVSTHLPMADKVASALERGAFFAEFRSLAPGTTTHLVTAIGFLAFGKSVYSSLVALWALKFLGVAGVYWLGRCLFGSRAGYFSGLVYATAPTVLFYSVTFYKEAAVQALVAWAFVGLYLFFVGRNWWALSLIFVAIVLVAFERIYLPLFLGVSYLLLIPLASGCRRIAAIAGAVAAAAIGYRFLPFQIQNPVAMFDALKAVRQTHMGYTDFHFNLNYGIPYPLAVIKALFTPYFTPAKFLIFKDFSYLLIWGSFLNQGIILVALVFWWTEFRRRALISVAFIVPLVLFVLVLGYVAPWAGRVRDSFYPFFAVYAGGALASGFLPALFQRLKNRRSILEPKQ